MRKRKPPGEAVAPLEHAAQQGQQNDDPIETIAASKEAGDKLIDGANGLSSGAFEKRYLESDGFKYSTAREGVTSTFSIGFKASKDISSDELSACFDLVSFTSRHDYEASSWGWHPKRKKREMGEAEMRYFLVRHHDSGPVLGFLSFMLTHDSAPSVPVLYIYEIHLASQAQSIGLGAYLMELAESVAGRVGVAKVMLTCFLSNENARSFYARRGYAADACSPEDRITRKKIIKVDYVILSKALQTPA